MKLRLLERTVITHWTEDHGSKYHSEIIPMQEEEVVHILQIELNNEWVDVPMDCACETVHINNPKETK